MFSCEQQVCVFEVPGRLFNNIKYVSLPCCEGQLERVRRPKLKRLQYIILSSCRHQKMLSPLMSSYGYYSGVIAMRVARRKDRIPGGAGFNSHPHLLSTFT